MHSEINIQAQTSYPIQRKSISTGRLSHFVFPLFTFWLNLRFYFSCQMYKVKYDNVLHDEQLVRNSNSQHKFIQTSNNRHISLITSKKKPQE